MMSERNCKAGSMQGVGEAGATGVAERECEVAGNDVLNELQEMCRCVSRGRRCGIHNGVSALLRSWYMPRDVYDVECYKRRFYVLRGLQAILSEILNKQKKGGNETEH